MTLEVMHVKMRERDRERIQRKEATPQQIQHENSLFRKPRTWSLPYLTA
jgi:hypothetical protein